MNINYSYPSTLLSGETYEFTSTGPAGTFPMAINFTPITGATNFYNLGFGLFTGGTIDDSFVTNNGDQTIILNTVSKQASLFLDKHPGIKLAFAGSNTVRTKLYERKIKRFYTEISNSFHIYGYNEAQNAFKPFYTGNTYDAFYIQKK